MAVRPLETEFRRDGFDYKQVKRRGDVALFEQRRGDEAKGYELVIIRVKPAATLPNGRSVSEREAYPSSEEWGVFWWTVVDRVAAFGRFAELVDDLATVEFRDPPKPNGAGLTGEGVSGGGL